MRILLVILTLGSTVVHATECDRDLRGSPQIHTTSLDLGTRTELVTDAGVPLIGLFRAQTGDYVGSVLVTWTGLASFGPLQKFLREVYRGEVGIKTQTLFKIGGPLGEPIRTIRRQQEGVPGSKLNPHMIEYRIRSRFGGVRQSLRVQVRAPRNRVRDMIVWGVPRAQTVGGLDVAVHLPATLMADRAFRDALVGFIGSTATPAEVREHASDYLQELIRVDGGSS